MGISTELFSVFLTSQITYETNKMPRRDIGILEYQPVVFRLVEPNTDSIADNFTDEEVTLYDKILGKCRVFGSQWCHLPH